MCRTAPIGSITAATSRRRRRNSSSRRAPASSTWTSRRSTGTSTTGCAARASTACFRRTASPTPVRTIARATPRRSSTDSTRSPRRLRHFRRPRRDEQRLEHGPAWGQPIEEKAADAGDWPTYRHDAARSGASDQPLVEGSRQGVGDKSRRPLSAMTIADGRAYVSQVDAHTLHALDAATGKAAVAFHRRRAH